MTHAPAPLRPDDSSGGPPDPAAVVVARGLEMMFGRVAALRGIDLEVERGELFALIGPDGAGKTTFFRLVAGLLRPTRGTISVLGTRSMGLVPQRFSLYEDLTVDENLRLRARLYDVPDAVAGPRARRLLARVGLDRFTSRLAGALSGGMKQKLTLVAALLTEPTLLLLDEPTTGVDPVSRREFWLLLNELHHEGLTVLVSTPYMDEAEYATRLGFLARGRLVALGTRPEVLAAYPRALVEVRSTDRVAVAARLAGLPEVDDVSLFGTRLHVRGREGVTAAVLEAVVEHALDGLVGVEEVRPIPPSLEDVFVLRTEGAVVEEEVG
jgi:ABC-2 type transport system ATP-binding protein